MIVQKTREQERMAYLNKMAKQFSLDPPVAYVPATEYADRYDPKAPTTLLEDVVTGAAAVVCIAAVGGACIVLQLARRVWP